MPPRIVIFTPVLKTGGTELMALVQTRSLVQAGYAVTVTGAYESDPPIVQQFVGAGATVQLLGRDRGRSPAAGGFEYLGLLRQLRTQWRREQPALVHVQYVSPGLVPVIAARLAGVPRVLATVHQSGRLYGWWPHRLLRAAARRCDRFLCVSTAVQQSWFGEAHPLTDGPLPEQRYLTLPNAVDVAAIATAAAAVDVAARRRDLGLPPTAPVMIFVGRLAAVKGVAFLLMVLARLAPRLPELRLLLVGEGPEAEGLRAQAAALGVAERCRWLGAVAPTNVPSCLALADLAVVPSRAEGFGLSAVEAMAAGKPVVATAVDGLAEIITPGVDGELAPYGDVAAFAEACAGLLHDPARRERYGQQAQARVRRDFDLPVYARRLTALYAQVLGSSGLPGRG